jgi:hypothetical protein
MVLDAKLVRRLFIWRELLRVFFVDQSHQVRQVCQEAVDAAAEDHLSEKRRVNVDLRDSAFRPRRVTGTFVGSPWP